MLETKKQKLINFLKVDDFKSAFKIAKNFCIELNKEQQRTIQIAAECLSGSENFYKSLKIDTTAEIEKAKKILIAIYL